MAHLPANEMPFTTDHAEQFIQPEVPMAELPADLPQDRNENRRYKNSLLLYPDATHNVRDFISQEDNESLDKSCGDGSANEICAFKLDQGKIDELANDYRVETNRESVIQKESRKETVKGYDIPSRNEDESRCKSNRKKKIRRKMPDGIIIDLSDDVYGTSHSSIKIGVISMDNLIHKMKFIAIPKKQYSIWNRNPRNTGTKKMIGNSVLAVLCAKNCSKMKKTRKSIKRKCKNHSKESMNNTLRGNANATVDAPKKFEDMLNGRRELHVENNTRSLCTPSREILDSTPSCHHDDPLVDIDNVQYPIWNTEQTCVDARKRIANYCSIFYDKRQEYHICDREDYNTDGSDFNAEIQTDWTAECFHPEYIRAKRCRCFCDTSECDPDINMQCNRCPPMSRMAKLFENSALPRKHQREEIGRFGSDELRTDIAPEFATGRDEYSAGGVEWCTNCDWKKGSSASTIWKHSEASKASMLVEPGGSVADLHDSGPANTSPCEIDTRLGKSGWWTTTTTTVAERDGDRSYKSDSLKGIVVDTWYTGAWRDNCIGRSCAGCVVAAPPCSDQHPGKNGESARGVDSEWKRGSIETDTQQLDYKWKRRIATVDASTRARVDFKGKRDSRYKSEETIRVQLHENAEIRKHESMKMVEAMSQTRSGNTNADDKCHETRDYSLWTSLQMGKIWSQVHDACKNVVKLAAASVGRVVKDAPKSERSQRNPVEVADATLVESSSSGSCASEICGETYRKNLMRSKSGEKTKGRQERTIGNVGKYHGDTVAPMRKNSRAITLPHRDMRKHAYQNAKKEEDGESCVNYIYSEHERDRYQDITAFSPRNETLRMHSHDEDVQSQSRLSESFTYLERSTYPGFRSGGGSDDNRNFTRGTVDDESMQRIYEEARSIRRNQSSTSKTCICYDMTQGTRVHCTDRSLQHVACYELSITTDHRNIHAGMPVASRNTNLLHHESQSTSVFSPEDNGRAKTSVTPEQTRSREEIETCEETCEGMCESVEDTIGAETERSFTSAIADAAVSSTEADPTVHSSRNDSDQPIASTSKCETSPASQGKSRRNRPGFKSPFCATMKFWRRRSSADNKTIVPVFKRSKRIIGRKPSNAAVATYGVKITQIEPSTVQTAQEGNTRAYVNVQVQTPDTIVTRILSEFLLSGEKRKRVLMTIMLQSESDHDRREAETQTSSDITSGEINVFSCPGKRPHGATTTASKTVQCLVCDKQDCYEMRRSDNSFNLEEALITEYPETCELNDYLAERKADIKISP